MRVSLLAITSLLVVIMILAIARLLVPDVLAVGPTFHTMFVGLAWKECIIHFINLTLAVVSGPVRAE